MAESKKKSIYVKTFGCQMNEYDTHKVVASLGNHEVVDSPEGADVVFINTCSVREKAETKLYSILGRIAQMKKEKPSMVVGVAGCVAQQEGEKIAKRSKAVDFIVGTHNLSLVPSIVDNVNRVRQIEGLKKECEVAVSMRDDWEQLPFDYGIGDGNAAGVHAEGTEGKIKALVAIQRGCSKKCSFCVVPTTRGPEFSRNKDEIIREVNFKVVSGAKEVLLLGQTVNSYGKDLSPRISFGELVKEVSEVKGLERIRFTSPHPQDVKDDFLDLYLQKAPKVCPHIHLPLQSGSDRVLKLMNRNYRVKRYMDIVTKVKEACPDIAITTDIIVGFPTETEEDFEMTLDVMREVGYSSCFSFIYSRRPNTEAIKMFKQAEEVPLEVAKARLQKLQALADELSLEYHQRFIDKPQKVLIERYPTKKETGEISYKGRNPQNVIVEILDTKGAQVSPGDIVEVTPYRATPHALRASF